MAGPAPQMAPAPAQQRQGLLGGFFGPQGRDARARLAIGLEGMTLNPNQAMIGQLQQGIEDRKIEGERNRTLEWLSTLNTPEAQRALQYAQATGDIVGAAKMALTPPDPMEGINLEIKKIELQKLKSGSDADPNVQSSSILRDFSGVVLTMKDGSIQVRTVGGQMLSGEEALAFVRKSQENYAATERSIYGARESGKLESQAALGGAAAAAVEEGKLAPQTAKEYFKQSEAVASSIRNMDSAIQAINEGAESGVIYNMLPNVTVASAELQNAKNRLGLDVIGSVTFGALSEGEMRIAMDTAVPSGLGPEQLKVWLNRKKEAQTKMLYALQEAALHFASGGSQEDYYRKIGIQSGAVAPPPSPEVTNAPTGTTTRLRFNEETGEFE
jgi:hypothetical protein